MSILYTDRIFRIYFLEDVLGSAPSNPEIYAEFIASKAPDAGTVEDEVAELGADAVTEKGTTIFRKTEEGLPYVYDYCIKGMYKDTCGGLGRLKNRTESGKLKAYKKVIDKLIFPYPRKIVIHSEDPIEIIERPLRAETLQGPRVTLARSEVIRAGAWMEFHVRVMDDSLNEVLTEWMDYGEFGGFGQWRNGGYGRFQYVELNKNGEVIGGNLDAEAFEDLTGKKIG